jgi:hypothetical protein
MNATEQKTVRTEFDSCPDFDERQHEYLTRTAAQLTEHLAELLKQGATDITVRWWRFSPPEGACCMVLDAKRERQNRTMLSKKENQL